MTDDEFKRQLLAELEQLRAEVGRMKKAMAAAVTEVWLLRSELDAARSGDGRVGTNQPLPKALH